MYGCGSARIRLGFRERCPCAMSTARLAGGWRAAAAALLLLALAVSAVSAAQQAAARIDVEESRLILRVYPDGAIQPIYTLKAMVYLQGMDATQLSLKFTSQSSIEPTKSYSKGSGSLNAFTRDASPGGLYVELRTGYSFNSGLGSWQLNGLIRVDDGGKVKEYIIDRFTVESREKGRVTVEFELTVPSEDIDTEGQAPTPDEINQQLAMQGINFIRVEELYVKLVAGGKAKIGGKAAVDLQGLADYAVANGASREDVQKMLDLLYSSYQVKGGSSLQARLTVSEAPGGGYQVTGQLDYESTMEGDVAKLQKLGAEMGRALTAVALALAQAASAQGAGPQLPPMLITGQMGPALYPVPPSNSETMLEIREIQPGVFRVEVSYQGHRLVLAGLEDAPPEERAGRTLVSIANSLRDMVQLAGMLQAFAPGAARLVPTYVEIQPAEGVEVSKTRATIEELPAIRVRIAGGQAAETQTPTPAPTQTPTQTATPTPTATPVQTQTGTAAPQPTQTQTRTASPTQAETGTPAQQQPTQTQQATAQQGGANYTVIAAVAVLAAAAVAAAVILRRR